MPINIYGAFRSDTNLSDNAVTFGTAGSTFQISAYSQITISDGADPTIIDGDNVNNELPNDPTQTYLGNVIDWDYTITVTDGVNNYSIGVMDWDVNGDGDFDFPTSEQGYFLAFLGSVPPLNTTLTFGSVTDNGPNIPVDTVVPCFTKGTLIQTPCGAVEVERLRVGDLVTTLDNGDQRIRWIGARELGAHDLAAKPRLRPIKIAPGALGCGLPKRDLLVSPQHRMLIRSAIAIRMFDSEDVLIAAHKLVGIPGISVVEETSSVTYFHLLFDRHEVIFAENAPAESLFTGEQALRGVNQHARAEILELFPQLSTPGFVPEAARAIPREGKRVKNLIHRHIKNEQPLIRGL